MDEIKRIKEQIQMLHERLEILEHSMSSLNDAQLIKLHTDIANIKIALYEIQNVKPNH